MAKSVTGATSASLPNVDQKPKAWHTGKDVNAGIHSKKKKRRGINPAQKALQAMLLARMMQSRGQGMGGPPPQMMGGGGGMPPQQPPMMQQPPPQMPIQGRPYGG